MTGADLRAWRERRGWSLRHAGEQMGLAASQLQRWESGERGHGAPGPPDAVTVPPYVALLAELLDATT